ncbi:hypothetical protein DBR43_07295 [Pedobacter sp. KBW06]|nr:hypothetical protein DBR43_07295 [Pedobacter sp. KBW06]
MEGSIIAAFFIWLLLKPGESVDISKATRNEPNKKSSRRNSGCDVERVIYVRFDNYRFRCPDKKLPPALLPLTTLNTAK